MASFETNPMGDANGTAIGPMREVSSELSKRNSPASQIVVMEGSAPSDPVKAVLVSAM